VIATYREPSAMSVTGMVVAIAIISEVLKPELKEPDTEDAPRQDD